MTEPDLFQASPFAEEYPLPKHVVAGAQDDPALWSSDMDHQLSLFVRKYCFDFAKASKALRSYVQHVLVEMDDVDVDSQAFTEDACRKRWAVLDMAEFDRRRGIARELMTMREVVESRLSSPQPPSLAQTPEPGARHLGEDTTPPVSATTTAVRASTELAPDPPRVRASPAPAAKRASASSPRNDKKCTDLIVSPRVPAFSDPGSGTGGGPYSLPRIMREAEPASSLSHQDVAERNEAWVAEAVPGSPMRTEEDAYRATGDSEDDRSEVEGRSDSDSQIDIDVVDPAELRRRALGAAMLAPAASAGVGRTSAGIGAGDAPVPMSMSEFEKRVESEQLERSDFTIFTHDLKKTCDSYYATVKANLPSIAVEEVTDDEDDDEDAVAPVFSNLQVNAEGEYVGQLRVGPLLEPSAVAKSGSARPEHLLAVSPSEEPFPASASPQSRPKMRKEAWGDPLVPDLRGGATSDSVSGPAAGQDESQASSDSSEGEVEEVIDAAELRRQAIRGGCIKAEQEVARGKHDVSQSSREQAERVMGKSEHKKAKIAQHRDSLSQLPAREKSPDDAASAESRRSVEARKDLDSKFAQAVKQDATLNVEIEAAQGLALLEKGQHAMAVVRLSAAITASGVPLPREDELATAHLTSNVSAEDVVKWLLARGKCYLELGQCFKAEPDLAKAVALDGTNEDARLQYAISLRFSSKYVEAQAQIKELLRLSPGHTYGKLEQRRLQQRIAHSQGRDTDTWRRKDGVISTAKEIQAIAERSIQASRDRLDDLHHRQREKELEEAFFTQIAQAKMTQEADRAEQAQRMAASSAILDVDLGGVDVDKLLQELQDMEPDPCIFPGSRRDGGASGSSDQECPADTRVENQDSPSLPPLLQALVSSADVPAPPRSDTTAGVKKAVDRVRIKREEAEREARSYDQEEDGVPPPVPHPADVCPPTTLELSSGARAAKSNVAQALGDAVATAGGAGPLSAPATKGSIGAKLRALREGGASRHMDVAASAASVSDTEASGNGEEMHEQLPSRRSPTPAAAEVATREQADWAKPVMAAEAKSGPPASGVDARLSARESSSSVPSTMAPVVAEAPAHTSELEVGHVGAGRVQGLGTHREMNLKKADAMHQQQQQRARGRFIAAASDEDEDDSGEEQDLLALRSQLKERSKKLSPQEQAELDRRREAREFLEARQAEHRAEQDRRKAEDEERRQAEKARKQEIAAREAESAAKRRALDRQRELREQEEKTRKEHEDAQRRAQEHLAKEQQQVKEREQDFASRGQAGAGSPAEGIINENGQAAAAQEEESMEPRRREALRLRDERLAAAQERHRSMMEGSKVPMPALPTSLLLELSQREALSGVLQWLVTPSNLAKALENAGDADREAYGVAARRCAASNGPVGFPFQVVGLTRGVLGEELCTPTLLPPATRKRAAETGVSQPVILLALGQEDGVGDMAAAVFAVLRKVSLLDMYQLVADKGNAPVQDAYLRQPLSCSLDSVVTVLGGTMKVAADVLSPLLWFVCAPAAVDQEPDTSGSMIGSADDVVTSVLLPEGLAKGALGPVLARAAQENLDLTSIRLVFPSKKHYERSRSFTVSVVPGGCPILVLGFRGFRAVERWSLAVGPEDPAVAKRTDPNSLRALYGTDRKRNLLTNSRSLERNRRESQWYFSLGHDMEVDDASSTAQLPALVMASKYAVSCTTMVLRAGVPGSFVARVVSLCLRSGFILKAFRRSRLEPAHLSAVGLPSWISLKDSAPPPVCLAWAAENAVTRLLRLVPAIERIVEDAGVADLLDDSCVLTSPPRQPAHRASRETGGAASGFATCSQLVALARSADVSRRCGIHLDLNEGPECIDRLRMSSRLVDMPTRFVVAKEMPQTVCAVVTPDAVTDATAMSDIFEALFRGTGAELLGAKLLTWLPPHVAAEMCPFTKDHYLWEEFHEHVENGPVFVLALRMYDGLESVAKLIGPLPGSGSLAFVDRSTLPGSQTLRAKFAVDSVRCAILAPADAKQTLRLLASIFEDEELAWPPSSSGPLALVPPPPACENVIDTLKAEAEGPPPLRTLALIKAEARHNFSKVLKYVKRHNFRIVAVKMLVPTPDESKALNGAPPKSQEQSPSPSSSTSTSTSSPVSPGLPPKTAVGGSLASPIIALVLQRQNAVAAWLALCGDEDPVKAKRENEFSLRAVFGTSMLQNGLHASASYHAAVAEVAILFPELGGQGGTLEQGDAICGSKPFRHVVLGPGGPSLKETALVVLCAKVMEEDDHYTVIDALAREDFKVVNLRLTWLSTRQATELAGALGQRALEDEARTGPCLLLAVERDSGLSRLQMAFKSRGAGALGTSRTLLASPKIKNQIFFSDSTRRAHAALAYSFDMLWDSAFRIEPLA